MRILHTSDWHLGKYLYNYSRLDEQKEVLQEIINIAEEKDIDCVVISGDIFDSFNPPISAEDLYYDTIKKLSNNGKRAVIIIAGNHDSPDRIEAIYPLAKECGIFIFGYNSTKIEKISLKSKLEVVNSDEGYFELSLPNSKLPLRILTAPYTNYNRLNNYFSENGDLPDINSYFKEFWKNLADKYCDKNGVNIIVSHSYLVNKFDENKPNEPDEEEKSILIGGAEALYTEIIPENIDYVALGHLHRYQKISDSPCNVIYSGSPLAYSFSEANQEKYVILLEIDENSKNISINPIKLEKVKKLYRKKFNSIEEAIDWLSKNQDCLLEIVIKTDRFISGEDRQKILNAHSGVLQIIPEFEEIEIGNAIENINIAEYNIIDLFKEFYKEKNDKEPTDEVIDIFKEILNYE